MKNKKVTYILILFVIIIWGMIIRWVIIATKDPDAPQSMAVDVEKDTYNDYSITKDTAHLLLNYRDPFGLVIQKNTTKLSLKKTIRLPTVKHVTNWDMIKYSGYMRNPSSRKLIAILTIKGKIVNMTEGETADNVKLIKNSRDSVKVYYEGESKFLKLHN